MRLLLVMMLLTPTAAQAGDDWYRVGPGPPYGYGHHRPGSYTNSPNPDWPAVRSVQQQQRSNRSKDNDRK